MTTAHPCKLLFPSSPCRRVGTGTKPPMWAPWQAKCTTSSAEDPVTRPKAPRASPPSPPLTLRLLLLLLSHPLQWRKGYLCSSCRRLQGPLGDLQATGWRPVASRCCISSVQECRGSRKQQWRSRMWWTPAPGCREKTQTWGWRKRRRRQWWQWRGRLSTSQRMHQSHTRVCCRAPWRESRRR